MRGDEEGPRAISICRSFTVCKREGKLYSREECGAGTVRLIPLSMRIGRLSR